LGRRCRPEDFCSLTGEGDRGTTDDDGEAYPEA
jgi:hypothetical protein